MESHLLVVHLQEGIIALWKGWLPSVIGVIPYVGLNFAVYETLKDNVLKFYGRLHLHGMFIAGRQVKSQSFWHF
jgi:hypothetical protein